MIAIGKKAMHAMLWLVVCFFTTACLFVLLRAEFVAVVQVLVYTGGILVLYMFAIMLVDIRHVEKIRHFHPNRKTLIATGTLILAELVFMITSQKGFYGSKGNLAAETAEWGGNSEIVGKTLFTDFILPFELVAIVLLVAILGAVVLGKIKERGKLLGEK
jgi:NADH-quinone oxidoreductase subunit J